VLRLKLKLAATSVTRYNSFSFMPRPSSRVRWRPDASRSGITSICTTLTPGGHAPLHRDVDLRRARVRQHPNTGIRKQQQTWRARPTLLTDSLTTARTTPDPQDRNGHLLSTTDTPGDTHEQMIAI